MIIIAGYSLTEATDRDAAVAFRRWSNARDARADVLTCMSARTRSMLSGSMFLERSPPNRASLDAWRRIADPPEVAFREIHVDLFRTEGAESPF